MAALGSWLNGLEKKEGTASWSFPTFCHISFNFMSHEKWWNFSLWRKGSTPVDTWPLLVWLDKLGPNGKELQLFSCGWNLAGQFTWSPAAGIYVWAGLIQLDFVVKLPWAWLSLQNELFCHGWYSWAFIKRCISWGMNNYISHEWGILVYVK